MKPDAAIIVSHGQPGAPAPPEAALARLAAQVSAVLPEGWQVSSATLATPGALETALEAAPANPLVYPMFMSEGWFARTQLPGRIGAAPARITRPFGTDPNLPSMAAALLQEVLDAEGWQAGQTTLFLAGHGSGRSARTAQDTRAFAAALAALLPFQKTRIGFVEQAPFLQEAAAGLGPKSICLPFFAAQLGHVLDDLPEALESAKFKGIALEPVGCAPQVPALIAEALLKAQADIQDRQGSAA